MKKLSVISLFFAYLKSHLKFLFISSAACVIFGIVFFLYILPVEAVLYAFLLTFVFVSVFFIADFSRFVTLHNELYKICKMNRVFESSLPSETLSLISNDYREICIRLIGELDDASTKSEREFSDMIEYYTMWVHQIKTPISAMRLLLQQSDRPYAETKSEISSELFKIEQYVEMVLGYLRLNDMSSDIIIKRYSLNEIVKQAIRKYSRQFIMKKISLNFDPSELTDKSGNDIIVITDEKWLVFVIEQIISNSVKYTKSGGSVSIYMKPDVTCTLVIEDKGIGIRSEDLPRIFERGFTGYNGRTDKKSTGIGLYLCRRILEKLSHSIQIKSEIRKGTIVEISLDTYKLDAE